MTARVWASLNSDVYCQILPVDVGEGVDMSSDMVVNGEEEGGGGVHWKGRREGGKECALQNIITRHVEGTERRGTLDAC
jgi:hypothetical protein